VSHSPLETGFIRIGLPLKQRHVFDYFINRDYSAVALSLRLRQPLAQKKEQHGIEEAQRTASQENRNFDFMRLNLTRESNLVVTIDYKIQE
jgi:uncharacterized protein (DUF2126 family)